VPELPDTLFVEQESPVRVGTEGGCQRDRVLLPVMMISQGEDPVGYNAEFINLVERARLLAKQLA